MLESIHHRNSFVKEEIVKEEVVKEGVIEEVVEKVSTDGLYDMTKKEQVTKLKELGIKSVDIKKLKYEADRVNKLFELMNQ